MKLVSSGAEARLVEYLTTHKELLLGNGVAIYFNFSQLLEHYRSDYQIKIATNLLTDLLKNQDGGIFLYKDMSVVVVSSSLSSALIDKAIFQLRYLFMDDPLAYNLDGQENPNFSKIYELKNYFNEVAANARARMLDGRRIPTNNAKAVVDDIVANQSAQDKPIFEPVKTQPKVHFFNASNLEQLEKKIIESDLLPAIRKQPVCATVPNMSVRRVFDELYLNINHLRQIINTDIDLISNRWLFKYLTLEMDNRVLSLLKQKADKYLGNPISLNLNVRTLMSEKFASFDASIKPAAKVSVVLEIQASDVFEDMYGFISARDYVQKLGYRICLDGLNNKSFCMIDRDLLGVDLLKLQWNASVKGDSSSSETALLASAVRRCGSNRIILTRCDNRQAVDYGQSLGISLFQGRYLDELIDPMSETVN
jgi:EAL domain-containing protein (putative c-di-GMP-specific phosphodiesterase class I)